MNVMIGFLESIEARQKRKLDLESDALDMLLFDLLQELIFRKDSEQLLLRVNKVRIETQPGEYRVMTTGHGGKLDPGRHEQKVDVKAVTLHQFSLEKTDDGWAAQVILDI
jgi:SHS2 domain-containing protein